jgi:arsenate reductase
MFYSCGMSITIYHNPLCGTSRNVLAILEEAGHRPVVVEYLKTPPGREEIKHMVAQMGVPLREVIRQKGTPYEELGLGNPALTDDALLDAIEQHPILLNRPIVVTPKGTKLCRPSETVLELL